MKILCCSDVHIFDYHSYSVYNGEGVPDRLNQYKLLADDIVKICNKNNIELIILAGDILQAPTVKPMVLNTAKYFFNKITETNLKVLCIAGNHDLDVKSGNSTYDHSVLSALVQDNKNIYYQPEEGYIEIQNIKFFLRSWNKPEINYVFEDDCTAHIAVLHGAVQSSVDPFGYEFKNGFSLEDLYPRFNLSIVGDIHNYQVFEDSQSGNKVLIPGQPIQQNFSSGFPCGLSIVDTEDYSIEFVNARSLPSASSYHYFKQIEPVKSELLSFPNTHYKVKHNSKTKSKNKEVEWKQSVNLLELIQSQLNSSSLEYKEEINNKLTEIYEKVKSEHNIQTPAKAVFREITISSFLSIQGQVTFNFNKEEDLILIRGSNGSGKSTVSEAFFWALTGSLTKQIPVSSITNDQSKFPASVVLDFTIGDDNYTVERTRQAGSLLRLIKNDSEITKASASDTQKLIYSILGVQEEDITLLTYFSLNELSLFSSLSINAQLDFISKLAQVEVLDEFKSQFKEVIQSINNELTENNSKYNVINQRVDSLKNKIQSLKHELAQENTEELVIDYQKEKETLNSLEVLFNKIELELETKLNDLQAVNTSFSSVQELVNKDVVIRNKITQQKEELRVLLGKQKSVKEGKCYTCGQELHDNEQLEKITSQIKLVADKTKVLTQHKFENYESQILDLENQRDLLQLEVSKLKQSRFDIQSKIKLCNSRLQYVPSNNSVTIQAKIDVLVEELNSNVEQLNNFDLEELKLKLASYTQASKFLDKSNKNVVYTQAINSTYNNFIEVVNGLFEPIGFKLGLSKNYDLLIKVDSNKERPIKALSGGEKRVFDVCIMLALNKIYQSIYNLDKPLLNIQWYDEVFVYLDPKYLQYIHGLLQELNGVKIVISNDESLIPLFQNSIFVTKTSKGSEYECNY